MDDQEMNVGQVLNITLEVLRGIRIPVELAQEVGVPVLGAMGNIRLCLEALAAAAQPAAAVPAGEAGGEA